MNYDINPPRLHRRRTKAHEEPPRPTFNFKKLKDLLNGLVFCCHVEKIDFSPTNDARVSRMTTRSQARKSLADNNSLKPRKSMGNGVSGNRRGSRRSIRAAINERKELEHMIQEQNNTNTNNLLGADEVGEVGRRTSAARASISKQGSSTALKTDKENMRAFRKQTRMNTAKNLRRNSTVGEQMQMELRRVSLAGQLRRGSRAEVGADVWEKIQQLKVERDPVQTRSGVTLAFENVDEGNENEENNDAQYNTNNSGPAGYSIGVMNDDENNNETKGTTYKIGIETTGEEQQDDYFNGDEQTASSKRKESDCLVTSNRVSTGIMKPTPSNMSIQSRQSNMKQGPISVNSALLAANFGNKLHKKSRERRSSIAFGDETTVHYDKHDRSYDRRGSFLHQQSRSILNIPVIEEGETEGGTGNANQDQ